MTRNAVIAPIFHVTNLGHGPIANMLSTLVKIVQYIKLQKDFTATFECFVILIEVTAHFS